MENLSGSTSNINHLGESRRQLGGNSDNSQKTCRTTEVTNQSYRTARGYTEEEEAKMAQKGESKSDRLKGKVEELGSGDGQPTYAQQLTKVNSATNMEKFRKPKTSSQEKNTDRSPGSLSSGDITTTTTSTSSIPTPSLSFRGELVAKDINSNLILGNYNEFLTKIHKFEEAHPEGFDFEKKIKKLVKDAKEPLKKNSKKYSKKYEKLNDQILYDRTKLSMKYNESQLIITSNKYEREEREDSFVHKFLSMGEESGWIEVTYSKRPSEKLQKHYSISEKGEEEISSFCKNELKLELKLKKNFEKLEKGIGQVLKTMEKKEGVDTRETLDFIRTKSHLYEELKIDIYYNKIFNKISKLATSSEDTI